MLFAADEGEVMIHELIYELPPGRYLMRYHEDQSISIFAVRNEPGIRKERSMARFGNRPRQEGDRARELMARVEALRNV